MMLHFNATLKAKSITIIAGQGQVSDTIYLVFMLHDMALFIIDPLWAIKTAARSGSCVTNHTNKIINRTMEKVQDTITLTNIVT